MERRRQDRLSGSSQSLVEILRVPIVPVPEFVGIHHRQHRPTVGVSGRLFDALGKAGINVLAIAQGSSECNISFVIDTGDQGKALKAVHTVFLTGAD